MLNIMLCCSDGMSTSLLVEKMKKAAEAEKIEAKIWAVGLPNITDYLSEPDVVLLGPQIRYKLSSVRSMFSDRNIPVEVINSVDYGMMNGDKILKFALDLTK